MKSILSMAFLLAFVGIKSQNNVVVFSENGEKFFLIVNGVKQNLEAETNVKVTDLIQPNYKIKVVFEDKSKGVVDQNIYLMNGGEPVKNYEFVYGVKVNKKAGYKIRPVSAVSTSEVKPNSAQTVVHYSTTEPTESNNNVISDGGNVNTNVGVSGNGTEINTGEGMVTTTQTEVKQTTTTNNTNVGVNINGMGVNININDNMGGMNGNSTTTTQTVITTKTSSSGNMSTNNSTSSSNSSSSVKTNTSKPNNQNVMPGYTGATGCAAPLSNAEFANVKKTIDTKSFEDTKIKIAKQVIDNNCLLSNQVKEIMLLFNFEDTRLDLAKYAYGHTYDIGNYYKLNDAFKFETSIDELDQYIKNNKTH